MNYRNSLPSTHSQIDAVASGPKMSRNFRVGTFFFGCTKTEHPHQRFAHCLQRNFTCTHVHDSRKQFQLKFYFFVFSFLYLFSLYLKAKETRSRWGLILFNFFIFSLFLSFSFAHNFAKGLALGVFNFSSSSFFSLSWRGSRCVIKKQQTKTNKQTQANKNVLFFGQGGQREANLEEKQNPLDNQHQHQQHHNHHSTSERKERHVCHLEDQHHSQKIFFWGWTESTNRN